MPLTTLTVTATNGYVQPNGTPGNGQVVLRPVAEATGGGYIVVAADVAFSVVGGAIVAPNQIASNAQAVTLQYLVYEQIQGATNPPAYVVTPTGATLDLSTASRGTLGQTTPIYVLASTVGQPNGPASLGSDGILTTAQRPAAGAGTVTSVAAADATIVIGGTATVAPTVRVGVLAESQITNLATDLATLTAGVAAAARKPIIRKARITTGTITTPSTTGAWQVLQQVGGAPFEIDLPASVNDWVEVNYNDMMRLNNTTTFFDIGIVVGSTIVRFLANDTNTGAVEGDPATYPQPPTFLGHAGSRGFDVTNADLDGGNVRFSLVFKSTGGNLLFAETGYQFYWDVKNLGPHN